MILSSTEKPRQSPSQAKTNATSSRDLTCDRRRVSRGEAGEQRHQEHRQREDQDRDRPRLADHVDDREHHVRRDAQARRHDVAPRRVRRATGSAYEV